MLEVLGQAESAPPRYEVRLPVFSGPLDLLLHLIERGQLDITLVSLAAVTNQYIEYVTAMADPDPDELADFLVIAARLLAIKAMALLARPQEEADEAALDAEDLLRALREYQVFKRIAEDFHVWEAAERRMYGRRVAAEPIRGSGLDGVTLEHLAAALRRVLAAAEPALPPAPPIGHLHTVGDKIRIIVAILERVAAVSFGDLVSRGLSRVEVIVTFLALLELLKRRRVTVEQTAVFGEIVIRPAGGQLEATSNEDLSDETETAARR